MQIATVSNMTKELRTVTASAFVAVDNKTRRMLSLYNGSLNRAENHKAAALAFLDKYDAGFDVEYAGTGITSGGNVADYWNVVN